MKAIISDRIWVPLKYIKREKLDALYVKDLFNEKMCSKCPYLKDRICSACEVCPGYLGSYKMYSIKEKDGKEMVGLPVGHKGSLKEVIGNRKVTYIDRRVLPRPKHRFKFWYKQLRRFQKKAVKVMLRRGYGVLKSAPRTGKTVMAAALIAALKTRTLILAHQDDLVKQFYETLLDPQFTNIAKLEEENGWTIVKIGKKINDFSKGTVVITNYQKFITKLGKKRLKKIMRAFGCIIIDETHRGNADGYSRVINSFQAKYRFGLTATPKRKDKKEFIIRHIIGPITHETTAKPMTPIIKVVNTRVYPNRNYHQWVSAMRFLERAPGRNELIVKHAIKDMKKGHSIVIPVTFQSHADTLITMLREALNEDSDINDRSGINKVEKFTGKVPKDIRLKIRHGAKQGKVRCIVAMRSMLTGVNIPRWSMIYEVIPMNNAPQFEQEIFRVCTIWEKPQPCVKFFIDDFNISRACFRSCANTLRTLSKKYGGFRFTDKSWQRARQHLAIYYSSLRSRKNRDDDIYKTSRPSQDNISF